MYMRVTSCFHSEIHMKGRIFSLVVPYVRVWRVCYIFFIGYDNADIQILGRSRHIFQRSLTLNWHLFEVKVTDIPPISYEIYDGMQPTKFAKVQQYWHTQPKQNNYDNFLTSHEIDVGDRHIYTLTFHSISQPFYGSWSFHFAKFVNFCT